jgi:hypothetical protein
LAGDDEKRRHDARLILGGLTPDDPVAPEALVSRLTETDEDIVFWAVIGLARLEDRAAVGLSAISRVAARHPAFGVRQAALEALPRIAAKDPEIKPVLVHALVDESPWVRQSALRAFISVPALDASYLAAIRALEHDPDEIVRHQAEVTLRNIRLRGSAA